jgi:hypothetical protein
MLPRARPRTARTSRPPDPWWGRLSGSIEGFPSKRGQPPKSRRVRGRETESRRSPPRLLALETLPRPRSLRAPRVAGSGLFPVRSDVGRGRCRHRRARLQVAHRREGPEAPELREEIRRSRARGAFHRRAIRAADGACCEAANRCCSMWAAPFSPAGNTGEGRSHGFRWPGRHGKGGQRAALLPIDRSAPGDFCVRVEVRSHRRFVHRELFAAEVSMDYWIECHRPCGTGVSSAPIHLLSASSRDRPTRRVAEY